MALVCKRCNLGIAIAKFYPGDEKNAGWYRQSTSNDQVNYFFELHNHKLDASSWGGNQYDLRYEIGDDTWQYDELKGLEEYAKLPTAAFSSEALEASK